MATKKTTKKPYAKASTKTGTSKPRPRAAKKGGKKGGHLVPAEEPIIIGGGSVYLVFSKKFKVKANPKHVFEHEEGPSIQRVVVFDVFNRVRMALNLAATDRVEVCYSTSSCGG